MNNKLDELKSKTGVLYVATGEKFLKETLVSIQSVRKHDSKIPIHIRTSVELSENAIPNDVTVELVSPIEGLWCKPLYISNPPFERTLFLDTDVVCVHEDAFLPFKILDKYAFALSHAPARMYGHLPGIPNCVSAYNSGVIFMNTAKPSTLPSLNEWKKVYSPFKKNKRTSDQAFLSRILWRRNSRVFVLPPEWNCRGPSSGIRDPAQLRFIHHRGAINDWVKGKLDLKKFCCVPNKK